MTFMNNWGHDRVVRIRWITPSWIDYALKEMTYCSGNKILITVNNSNSGVVFRVLSDSSDGYCSDHTIKLVQEAHDTLPK